MPARNSHKDYLENGYYHLYNRGVEKRQIFLDEQDYGVFLSYLKEYLEFKDVHELQMRLSNSQIGYKEKDKITKLLRLNNFQDRLSFIAYCLMPNHFHFLVKQKDCFSIDNFMNSLGTRYTMYFNRKYRRVGTLYQGVYKAVLVKTDEQLLHLSRYIHSQALSLKNGLLKSKYPSSYENYLKRVQIGWVKPEEVLNFFFQNNPRLSYTAFMGQKGSYEAVSDLILEDYYVVSLARPRLARLVCK